MNEESSFVEKNMLKQIFQSKKKEDNKGRVLQIYQDMRVFLGGKNKKGRKDSERNGQ